MLDTRSRWKSSKTQYLPGSKERISGWPLGCRLLRGLGEGGAWQAWEGLVSFSAVACAGLQLLALAWLRWCLHGIQRRLASSGIPVERLGWLGWRSREAASRRGFEQLLAARSSACVRHSGLTYGPEGCCGVEGRHPFIL